MPSRPLPTPLAAAPSARDAARDAGFTLVELLVVLVIMGILSAIAAPTFLEQRQRGWDAAVQADLRNAAAAQETALAALGAYVRDVAGAPGPYDDLEDLGFRASPGSHYGPGTPRFTVLADAGNTFCVSAVSASGQVFSYSSTGGPARLPCPSVAPY